ncbi:MAG: hypothetical protein NVS2B9_11450 [Myxococcales bacterium]
MTKNDGDDQLDPTSEQAILGVKFQEIDHMQSGELDRLPFGAIQLDPQGKVLRFNFYESSLSNLSKEQVLGRNFFKEVAPCTDVREFHGRFQEGVAKKQLLAKFNYHFAFKQNPRDVQVTLFYSDVNQSVWVFVRPR